MTGILRVPRTRGALSGVLLVLLGLWGGLVPLLGPYFDFGFTPDKAWTLTSGRVWLQIVPACAAVLGGLIVLASANRAFAAFGAWIAALGGAWFAVAVPISAEWAPKTQIGAALGGTGRQITERVACFEGLGVVVVFFAALALGRFAVLGVKEANLAARNEPYVEEMPVPEPRSARPPIEQVPETPPDGRPTVESPRLSPPADRKVAGGPTEEDHPHSADRT